MFKNTSSQVKTIAYAVFIIGVLITLYCGFVLVASNVLLGIIVIALGLAASYALAILIDALAQLLENTEEIKQRLKETEKQQDS